MRSKAMRKRAEMPLSDFGTPEIHKRLHLVVETAGMESHTPGRHGARHTEQRPLDRYCNRGWIGSNEYAAGNRLRQDWDWSVRQPSVVTKLGGVGVGRRRGELVDIREDARRRKNAALNFVGPLLTPVLTAVVCEDQPVKAWGLANGGGKRGMGALRAALQSLCRHYRL